MVNTQLFQTNKGTLLPAATVHNAAGAPAYALSPRHQLAQLAATGCLNQTFYANAESQLDTVLALAQAVEPEFVAKTAIYARQAHMKDMPVLLAAHLAVLDVALLARVFGRVVDNGKTLRGFVQMLRSGQLGRKSLGTRPKKLVQQWLLSATEQQLLNAAVGTTPSLADVVKMVHPKPAEAWRAAWFAWLIGRPYDEAALPPLTLAFERFKRELAEGKAPGEVPAVPFQLLTALPLKTEHWAQIARDGSWQMVRQNLNTLARQGVFGLKHMENMVANKLSDAESVRRARVLPFQLLSAYKAADEGVPAKVREALQDAMELALANVPAFQGRVVVCPDVSGSMSSPLTGHRGSATSTVRCIDVAALVAAAISAKNRGTRVLPFENDVVKLWLNPRDSVMTQAQALAAIGGGGTNCSAPLALLNREKAEVDVVVFVSDNESWVDARRGATQTLIEWEKIKQRNPQARLICLDLQPNTTTQVAERADVMNIGGFSDAVFETMARFAQGQTSAEHWVSEIDKIALAPQ